VLPVDGRGYDHNQAGTVAGRVIHRHQSEERGTISIAGRELSGVVVFLDPVDGEIVPVRPENEATIRQKDVKFDPALLSTQGSTPRVRFNTTSTIRMSRP